MLKSSTDNSLTEKEQTLLSNMLKYVELQPKKELDMEALSTFFKTPIEVIEKIIVSEEGQVLVDAVTELPKPTSRSKVEIFMPTMELKKADVTTSDLDAKDKVNNEFLARLALDKVTYEDALHAHAQSHTIDKMKLFQLQQAKSELLRVIRMMDTFNLLQDKYREQIEQNIDLFEIDEIVQHNKIAFGFIQQSMTIVDKFTNDDTLKILIMDNNVDTEREHMQDIVTGEQTLLSRTNRKEVIKSAEKLIAGLSNIQEEVTKPEPVKVAQSVQEAEIITEELDEDVPLFEQLQKDKQND